MWKKGYKSIFRGVLTKDAVERNRFHWVVQKETVGFVGLCWDTIRRGEAFSEEKAEKELKAALETAREAEEFGRKEF